MFEIQTDPFKLYRLSWSCKESIKCIMLIRYPISITYVFGKLSHNQFIFSFQAPHWKHSIHQFGISVATV